jgi:hypothetical protein
MKIEQLIKQTEKNLNTIKKKVVDELKKPGGGVKAAETTGLTKNNFYNFIHGRSNMSWEKILKIAKKILK